MCTVTFIPSGDKLYITSNRDEKHWRSSAFPPALYPFQSGILLFPKDGDAGGTWIAAHENGNAIVFLNGGFVCHQPTPPYRKSRGLVLLDLLDSANPVLSFSLWNLQQIEPFTAVIWNREQLFECRWDSAKKHGPLCVVEERNYLTDTWNRAVFLHGGRARLRAQRERHLLADISSVAGSPHLV